MTFINQFMTLRCYFAHQHNAYNATIAFRYVDWGFPKAWRRTGVWWWPIWCWRPRTWGPTSSWWCLGEALVWPQPKNMKNWGMTGDDGNRKMMWLWKRVNFPGFEVFWYTMVQAKDMTSTGVNRESMGEKTTFNALDNARVSASYLWSRPDAHVFVHSFCFFSFFSRCMFG